MRRPLLPHRGSQQLAALDRRRAELDRRMSETKARIYSTRAAIAQAHHDADAAGYPPRSNA